VFVRILKVAAVEFRGVFRSHPFRLFLPVAALVVVGAPRLVVFAFHARDAMVAQVGVSAAALFATLIGLLGGAASISRERARGVTGLLLSRPLGPAGYVTGKWLGLTAAAGLAVAGIGAVHLGVLALGGGAPGGWGPLVAALLLAAVGGSLAAAIGLLFSVLLRPGAAFLAGLGLLLASHAAALAGGEGLVAVRLLLPRAPDLHLASEAAFGPFPPALFLLALAHGILYALFLVALSGPLLRWTEAR